MFYYVIPLIVIIVSLALIVFLIWQKLPQLSALNVESIVEEKELAVRNRLILERLKRKTLFLRKLFIKSFQPLAESIKRLLISVSKKVGELEKEAQRKDRPLKGVEVKQEIKTSLEVAETLVEQDKFNEAEEAFIKILNLDSHNVAAYQGLIKVYLGNKDYKKAKDICRYAIKLLTRKGLGLVEDSNKKNRLAGIYEDLGFIYQSEGKYKLALGNFTKAVELEPNNPRMLDLLLKISIMLKRKEQAWETFNALKKADPNNKKLPELKKEIEKLSNKPT